MHLVRPASDLLEHIYDVELPTQRWVESVRRAAAHCFADFMAVQAYLFQVGFDGSFECQEIASDPDAEGVLREAHGLAAPSLIRKLY
jgi:hypothetical protein